MIVTMTGDSDYNHRETARMAPSMGAPPYENRKYGPAAPAVGGYMDNIF